MIPPRPVSDSDSGVTARPAGAGTERFERLRPLGAGSFGEVDLVREAGSGSLFARKVVPLREERRLGILEREVRLRARLPHPQIPEIHQYRLEPASGTAFLLSDFVEADTLLGGLVAADRRGGVDLVLAQALNVLSFVHQRGIVHGDVQPENLLVGGLDEGEELSLTLIDFGTALDVDSGESEWRGGVPAFLAPWLLDGVAPSPASDLFALGQSFLSAADEGNVSLAQGTRDVLLRLTQSDPDLAFPDADRALDDLLARNPVLRDRLEHRPLPLPRHAPFVGREREKTLLGERLEALHAGLLDTRLQLLEGEPGIGKSRLLREFARMAVLSGAEVHHLPCAANEGALEPVLDLLTRLLPGDHPELARLIRTLAPQSARARRERSLRSAGPEFSQRALRDLARVIRDEAVRRPLVLIVDNFEEADECTVALFDLLGRLEGAEGPLVVAALPAVLEPAVPAAALVAPWSLAHRMQLGPLGEEEIGRLVDGLLPRRLLTSELRAEAVLLSRGSPRDATESALCLAEGEGATPGRGLGGFFTRLLQGCSRREREVLVSVALLGRAAPLEVITGVLGEEKQRSVSLLRSLVRDGLVHCERRASGERFRIASGELSRELLGELSRETLRRLHGRALECWSAWPVSFERPGEQLALHALGAGLIERAFELGLPALTWLSERGALRTAERLARALLSEIDSKGVQRREERHRRLIVILSRLQLRRGRPEEAARTARTFGDPESEATLFEAPERAELLRLLGNVAEASGDYPAARRLFEHSLRAARLIGPSADLSRIAEALGLVFYREGNYAEARTAWEKGLARGTEQEDRGEGAADLWNDLGVLDWMEGNLDAALSHHAHALKLRRRAGNLDGESSSLTNLGAVFFARGELTRSVELHTEALRLKRLVGGPGSQALSLRNLAVLHRHRGEYGLAIECLGESIALREAVGEVIGAAATRIVLSRIRRDKGEQALAQEALDEARSALAEANVRGVVWADLCVQAARMAGDVRDLVGARGHVEDGLEALEDADVPGTRADLLGVRAGVELESGDLTAGLATLEQALGEARRSKDRVQVAWAERDLAAGLALALEECGGGETEAEALRGRARKPLAAAVDAAREMALPELLAASLLVFHDLERGGPAGDDAVRTLLEAEHVASRLALPRLELACARRMGAQAAMSGLSNRAVHWYRRGLAALERLTAREESAPGSPQGALGLREHARLCAALTQLLDAADSEAGAAEGADTTTDPADPRGLATRADAFLHRSNDGEGGGQAAVDGAIQPRVLRRLLEISRAVNSMRHREEILTYLCDRLEELFGAENSRIVLLGRDGSYHLMGESEEATGREISRTVIQRVLSEGRPILVDDARRDLELMHRKSVHRLGLASVLCAPLIVDGKTIGIIQFDHREKPGPFRPEDLAVLELFAHQAATALKNMLLVERLDETIDELRASEAEREAGERMRSLGEMTAGVAHDFNNLLTIVVGVTDLMRRERGITSGMLGDLEILETVSKTAAETVRRLQEFRGESRDRWARIDVSRVVRQAVELGRRRYPRRGGVTILVEAPGSPVVLGVEAELREVLLNLIINAYEAMPKGGVIQIRCEEKSGRVHLSVEDEGEGVPADLAARVFEPFFSTKKTGQGMGLSVSRDVVRRLGGSLTLETLADRDTGAAFRVSLPAAPPREEQEPGRPRLREISGSARILVVDDDPMVREVVRRLLGSAGFRAVAADGRREAMELFRQEAFDLVLTDYAMPDGSGWDLAREIKRVRPDCPVVLLTGATMEGEDIQRIEGAPGSLGAGGSGENDPSFSLVLRKPITAEKLAAALSMRRN